MRWTSLSVVFLLCGLIDQGCSKPNSPPTVEVCDAGEGDAETRVCGWLDRIAFRSRRASTGATSGSSRRVIELGRGGVAVVGRATASLCLLLSALLRVVS